MKRTKTKKPTPTRGKLTIFAQLCTHIPGHVVAKLARETGVDEMARTFSAWSHLVALLYAQLTHAIGLNDVCDGLRHHVGWLARILGATTPSRNGLSHANKHRDAVMAEKLFWAVLAHLKTLQSAFGSGQRFRGLTGRFKRVVHVVDSTTIQLVASCIDWAKHRRRKAAAKCHLRLDLQSLLPRFAIVDTAGDNDNARALAGLARQVRAPWRRVHPGRAGRPDRLCGLHGAHAVEQCGAGFAGGRCARRRAP